MSGAVWYRFRADLRRSGRVVVSLAVLVAVVGGLVIASLAGAARSRSALDRLVETMNPADAIVFADGEALSRLADVAAVETVARTEMFAVFPTAVDAEGVFLPMFASVDGRVPAEMNRPRVIDGRLPEPGAPHEIALRERTARLLGVRVGADVEMASMTPEETQVLVQGGEDIGSGGPQVVLKVVGLVRDASDVVSRETDMPIHYLTPAFAVRYAGRIGVLESAAFVSAEPGVSSDELVSTLARAVPNGTAEPVPGTRGGVQAALDVVANGLSLFAAVVGLAGIVALAQTLVRLASGRGGEQLVLSALGFSRRDRAGSAALTGVVVGVFGAIGALVVALALSRFFPIGVARRAEPNPGYDFDVTTVLGGVAALVVAITAAAVAAGWFAVAKDRRGARLVPARTSPGSLPPPVVAGVFLASARSGGGVPIRSTRTAVALGSIGVVAALVFAASLARLVDTPRLYGWGFDAGLAGTENDPESLRDGVDLDTDRGIEEAAPAVFQMSLRVNDHQVMGHAIGFGGEHRIGPVVASGRVPAGDDEIAVGRDTLDRLGIDIGDVVNVEAHSGAKEFRVVGQAVMRVNADGNTTIGSGVLMTVPGGERLGFDRAGEACRIDESCYVQTAVRWAAGTDMEQTASRILADGELSEFSRPVPPGEVERLTEVEQVPWILAAVLGALAAAATAHTVAVTARRRRRDLSVLRTLGFTARQMRTSVSVQAALVVLAASVVGAVVGVVAGRAVWAFVADALGVARRPVVPPLVVLVPVAMVLISQAIAVGPARAVSRLRPASVLRAE